MNEQIPTENTILYSFSQLINSQKQKYKSTTVFEEKEKIVSKLIFDPEISKDFLIQCINMYKKSTDNKKDILINTFQLYFNTLQYSLSTSENFKFYSFLEKLDPNMSDLNLFNYLAQNDPIKNFTKFYEIYFKYMDEINLIDKRSENLKIIKNYIDDMLKIYNIDFRNYYFPPMKEFPTYVYNYYFFLFLKILKKFQKKRIKSQFIIINNNSNNNNNINNNIYNNSSNNNEKEFESYSEEEEFDIHYKIGIFFKLSNKLFTKFNYKNINKDLKILKIILFYFQNFEFSRNINFNSLKKIFECINSEQITKDILKRFQFYRKNSNIPITESDWDSIDINENLYIKTPYKLEVKIKYFRKDILNFEDMELIYYNLNDLNIENLNFDGLIQNSICKYSPEIENYTKELLKTIFSSKNYINYFEKHGKRFNNSNKINLLKNIFQGPNSTLIFQEIWENIFFIPFIDSDLSGFNNRNQYSIFINSIKKIDFKTTFNKIVPQFHCEINNLYHEISHNFVLLLAANLDDISYETIEITDKEELEELKNLQNKYFGKNNQKIDVYDKYEDFGDLMEIEMYGIRPRKYKTFSGLFCLNKDSYNLDSNQFREICVGLYNYEIEKENKFEESQKKNAINEENYNYKEILEKLFKSEIAKLLMEYFEVNRKNEVYIEDGKPREISFNNMYNEEYTVDIDYWDKLDSKKFL